MPEPLKIVLWKCGGPRYRTRGGTLFATVTESNVVLATGRRVWQGWLSTGEACEWREDGTHPFDPSLDLVAEVADDAR